MALPVYVAYGNTSGTVSDAMIRHYEELALSGAGAVVVESTLIDASEWISTRMVQLDKKESVEGLKIIAGLIKKAGTTAGCQINHPGRFAPTQRPPAPSEVPVKFKMSPKMRFTFQILAKTKPHILPSILGSHLPRSMTLNEIKKTINQYAAAAEKIKKGGFDFVELHGATGYLLTQFISKRTNKRNDLYGGSFKNRVRFPLQVVDAVREAVGSDYPVGYRFLAEEWVPDGFTLDEARIFARLLEKRGIAYISVTAGTYESLVKPKVIVQSQKAGYMVELAEAIKKEVSVPVIASGRIAWPLLAEKILEKNKADAAGLGRILFADNRWAIKAITGREREIIECDPKCNNCLICVMLERPAFCPQWPPDKIKKRREFLIESNIKHFNRENVFEQASTY